MFYKLFVLLSLLFLFNGCIKLAMDKKEPPNTRVGKLDFYRKQISSNKSDLTQHFLKKRDLGIKNCITRIVEISLEIKNIGIDEKYIKEIDEIAESMKLGLADFARIKNYRLIERNFDKNYSKLRKLYVKIKETITEEKE